MRNFIYVAIALSLLGSTAAVARRDNPNYESQNARDYQNDGDRGKPYDQRRNRDPRQNNGGRSNPQGFNAPNSDRPDGERLSVGYLENRYVVSDWRGNRLHRPARGQHWVRVNNQSC